MGRGQREGQGLPRGPSAPQSCLCWIECAGGVGGHGAWSRGSAMGWAAEPDRFCSALIYSWVTLGKVTYLLCASVSLSEKTPTNRGRKEL